MIVSEPIGKKGEDGDGTEEEGGDGTELEISPSATVRTRENKAMSMDCMVVRSVRSFLRNRVLPESRNREHQTMVPRHSSALFGL